MRDKNSDAETKTICDLTNLNISISMDSNCNISVSISYQYVTILRNKWWPISIKIINDNISRFCGDTQMTAQWLWHMYVLQVTAICYW